ncbi:MAG: hypothetical protein CMJ87_13395 [Planctomycetes bacterium]|nr:hypothetical protein [Planctomycetota bacterium]
MSRPALAAAIAFAWAAALPGGACASTEDDRLMFESCTILYQANRYDDAAGCYRSLLDGGVRNGPAHANLANAYMHLERHGEAVYHYRQAQLFLPRDSEVRGHLSRALAAAGLEREPPRPAASRVLFFYDRLSPGELWGIAAILNVVLWGLLIIRLYRRGEIVTWAALVVFAGLLLFSGTAAARTLELTTRPGAVVLSGTAVARSGRDRSASEMFRLTEGSGVTVTARQGGWVAVETEQGRRGWVEADVLGVIEYARVGIVGRDQDGARR